MKDGTLRFVLCLLGLVIAGCTEPNPAYWQGPFLPEDCRVGEEVSESFEAFERPEKVDLLFVVANSGEIQAHQEALAWALPPILEAIDEAGIELRVAVTTTDPSPGGELLMAVDDVEGCEDNTEQVAEPTDSDWLDTAACNMRRGVEGARRQQPLQVLMQALVEEPEALEGFRRSDARMVAVIVSNQDDCSGGQWSEEGQAAVRDQCAWRGEDLREVSAYIQALGQSAVVAEGFSLAVISGPAVDREYEAGDQVRPVCSSTLGSSYPSWRLSQAARGFGDQGLFLTSCVLDYTDHLAQIAERLILRQKVTLCPAEAMAQEPLEVRGLFEGGDDAALGFGSGFVFTGPTEACENGGIELRGEGASGLVGVELRYCAFP